MSNQVRTRFAPSPTGFMHLGGLRTALYGYLFAKKMGGKFILRIEDTDQERFVEGATEVIYDTLRGCGINWDEGPDVGGDYGPYIQSERKATYLPYAKQLVKTGHAYYCFCTKCELDERRAAAEARGEVFKYDKHCMKLTEEEVQAKLDAGTPYVIRQNAPTTGESSYDDLVFGHMTFPNDTLDDMILIKADGMPTYNFANVIDDHLMGITHVVRGSEYLASAPKYNLLYEAFGWEIPTYIHCSPVMRDAQHKMSKRHGDPSYEDLKNQGYLTDAIINYVALLGWSPRGEVAEQEFFTLEELVTELRQMGEHDISGLKYVIMETSGQLSVVHRNPEEEFFRILIADGEINRKNLRALGRSEDWLEQFAIEHRIRVSDIFYLAVGDKGTLNWQKTEEAEG